MLPHARYVDPVILGFSGLEKGLKFRFAFNHVSRWGRGLDINNSSQDMIGGGGGGGGGGAGGGGGGGLGGEGLIPHHMNPGGLCQCARGRWFPHLSGDGEETSKGWGVGGLRRVQGPDGPVFGTLFASVSSPSFLGPSLLMRRGT